MTKRSSVYSSSAFAAYAAASAALIVAFSVLERFLPVGAIVPLPGVKLGLGNVVLMFLVTDGRIYTAFAAAAVKIVLSFIVSGSPAALFMSLSGTLAALVTVILLKSVTERGFSYVTLSVVSSFFFNLAQVSAASLIYGSAVMYYFPVLAAVSLVTGTVTGMISNLLFPRIRNISQKTSDGTRKEEIT